MSDVNMPLIRRYKLRPAAAKTLAEGKKPRIEKGGQMYLLNNELMPERSLSDDQIDKLWAGKNGKFDQSLCAFFEPVTPAAAVKK